MPRKHYPQNRKKNLSKSQKKELQQSFDDCPESLEDFLKSDLGQQLKKQFEFEKARDLSLWKDLKAELEGINQWKYYEQSDYQMARKLLYESLLPLEKDRNASVDEKTIRKAGELLYKSEGMNGMHDRLLWAFIPKECHRFIECYWDGIGDWKD
jgi:hypothetical protein